VASGRKAKKSACKAKKAKPFKRMIRIRERAA
jgi:hypothetical protein